MVNASRLSTQPAAGVFTRLYYALKIWFMNLGLSATLNVGLRLFPSSLPLGDVTRRYPPLNSLETRIYLPPGSNGSNTKYPLYVSLHGGGYCVHMPDHSFCRALSTKANIAVASVTYRKAPYHVFPTQLEDVAATINEILADSTLPIDREKGIIIGGMSAGGNATLGLAQNPLFRGMIRGIVPMYSPLDHTRSIQQRLASRPAGKDMLGGNMDIFQWAYIPVGHDLKDPVLSPAFAKVEDLPQRIYFVVAELDILAGENKSLAEKVLEERFPNEEQLYREQNERMLRIVGGNQEVVFEFLKGMEHGFFELPQDGWKFQSKSECLERLVGWVKETFAGGC